MRHLVLAGVALLFAAACGGAASGAEETFDGIDASALSDAPDPAGACDAARIRDHVVRVYSAGADSAAGGLPMHRGHDRNMFRLLGFVYDADDSASLDEAEQAAIVSDFTAGCAAFAARLLAEFDTDGDGTLSAEELAAARATLAARHPAPLPGDRHPPEDGSTDDVRPPPPPDGATDDATDDADRPPPPDGSGHRGPPPDGACPRRDGSAGQGARPSPMQGLVAEYDVDGDGTLNAEERATLRAAVRARIVAGESPFARPGPAANPGT